MNREFIKSILQKGISPFLSDTTPQKRYAIVHDLLPAHRKWFKECIDLIDRLPFTDVTLTFDDGFYSSYQAIKELKNRKAIFFVCPEYINRAETSKWQEFFHGNLLRTEDLANRELCQAVRPASWDELRELVRLGHTIGSHSMNHLRLSGISSQKALEREIIGSAETIEDKLQIKVDAIAYPFGNIKSINAPAIEIIKKKYTHCFSGLRGNNHTGGDQLIQWRDAIHFPWFLEYIAFLLRGGFDWYYGAERRRLLNIARRV